MLLPSSFFISNSFIVSYFKDILVAEWASKLLTNRLACKSFYMLLEKVRFNSLLAASALPKV
jgi:hypothetical protein